MPGQFESILDKLQRKLGKQTIRKASSIARPKPRPDVIQMQAINDFVRRNPRAGGGLLNGSSEEAAAAAFRKKVEELMDDGYDFGEAVREAMRQGYAKAGLVDPANNVKKGQELGKNITQKIDRKRNKVDGYSVGIGGNEAKRADKGRTFFSKSLKKAQQKRIELEKKYVLRKGAPTETLTWENVSKKPNFLEFFEKEIKINKDLKKSMKVAGLTSDSPREEIFNAYKKLASKNQSIDPKVKVKPSEKIIKGSVNAMMKRFNVTFKREKKLQGTLNVKELSKKLGNVSPSKIKNYFSDSVKSLPSLGEQTTRAGGRKASRIRRGVEFKNALKKSGIKVERTGIKGGLRFTANDEALDKLKKNFNFKPKGETKVPLLETFSQASKKTPEWKAKNYAKDLANIERLTKNLNNKLKFISNNYTEFDELRKFIKQNKKLLDLVESSFDPLTGKMTRVSLDKIPDSALRGRLQMQVDHIRGRETVVFDKATKKILDGLDIEYPKNLYIVPQSVNNSTKRLVENWVANNPKETKKIKALDNWFKKRDLSYYDTNKKIIRGAEPKATSSDIKRLGFDLKKTLLDPTINTRTGQTIIEDGPKLLEQITERNKFLIKDSKTLSDFAKTKGVSLQSFAGFVDFTNSGIELPPAVRQAANRLLNFGGKALRGLGKGAVVLDPMFAAYDFSEAIDRGVGGKEAAKYTGKRFVEGVLNLPDLVASGAKFAKDKAQGKDTEFKTGILYEPFTFAQESLDRAEAATPKATRLRNIAQRDFDTQVRPGMTMVDDMEIPASQEQIKAAEQEFIKNQMGPYYKYGLENLVEEEEEKPLQPQGLLGILAKPNYEGVL